MNRIAVMLALILLASPTLVPAQATQDEIQRATDGALRIKKILDNPDNFVLDSVTLALGKHGKDVCYAFHSRSAWDYVGRTFRGSMGERIETADLTTKGKLRVWPATQGQSTRPCCHQERYQVTDITKEVRGAGGFLR
jgi:hypothetical protein